MRLTRCVHESTPNRTYELVLLTASLTLYLSRWAICRGWTSFSRSKLPSVGYMHTRYFCVEAVSFFSFLFCLVISLLFLDSLTACHHTSRLEDGASSLRRTRPNETLHTGLCCSYSHWQTVDLSAHWLMCVLLCLIVMIFLSFVVLIFLLSFISFNDLFSLLYDFPSFSRSLYSDAPLLFYDHPFHCKFILPSHPIQRYVKAKKIIGNYSHMAPEVIDLRPFNQKVKISPFFVTCLTCVCVCACVCAGGRVWLCCVDVGSHEGC